MAQTTIWKIEDMKHDVSSGGVVTVYWKCNVQDNDNKDCNATEGGKLRLKPDASASDFIAYDDLKESDVLGWVYNSLIKGDETAEEAKARVEKNRQDRVAEQVSRNTSEASGLPWQIAAEAE